MRYLPNVITALRILFTPWIAYFLAQKEPQKAFPLLFFAGFSDALDGYLARRFGWSSKMGALLDPIADKLLAITLWIGLTLAGRSPVWMLALALGRDAMILGFAGAALAFTHLRSFPPSIWGKLSTFFQLSYCGWQVMDMSWNVLPGWWLEAWLWLAAVATVASGVDYARTAVRLWPRDAD